MDRIYELYERPEGWVIIAEPVGGRTSWVTYAVHPTREAAVAHLMDIYARQRALLDGVADWRDPRSH